MNEITRRSFLGGATATAAVVTSGCAAFKVAPAETKDYDLLQDEISKLEPSDYREYCATGKTSGFICLERLEAAFDKVLREVQETVVTDKPAVWLVYNMGTVVKTKECCFAIDLRHVRGQELAPYLDFALITHNHGDHWTEPFYRAMNGAGKTVISNFKDNYGAADWKKGGADWAKDGGYTRAEKIFKIKDVEIKTGLTDHNGYLVDFTSTFEITIGGKYRIYHSGDCSNVGKLNPQPNPDLWILHPACGMNVADGVKKFQPKLTVIAHLNELGHANGGSRWTWRRGLEEGAKAEAAGGKFVMPLWGERIVISD